MTDEVIAPANNDSRRASAQRFYWTLTQHPGWVLSLSSVVLVFLLAGLPQLKKDTSISAFIPNDHPSLAANDRVKETFGLADAVAIAVVVEDTATVFSPELLSLIDSISVALMAVPNLREDRVASVTTESSISGAAGAIEVDDYLPWFEGERPGSFTEEDVSLAADAAARWRMMPPHESTLVADDGRAAIVMAEMLDDSESLATWRAVSELVEAYSSDAKAVGAELLLAGPGSVSGYFSAYINQDVRILLPAGFVFVLLFVYLAFLRAKALVGPLFLIIATVGGALGIMGWMGVDYFAITNSLPVILVAIAVADAIHVLSAYYIERSARPQADTRSLVVSAMQKMTKPILLTSITTIAGFVGLGAVSIMPPISYFAVYAALGVGLACACTILVLPALLLVLDLPPSPAFANWQTKRGDWLGRSLLGAAQFARRNALSIVALFLVAGVSAALVAGNLRIDRSQVENFRADEPLRLADERINEMFAGTAFLNLMVESAEPGALIQPAQMQAVSELQATFEAIPGVQKTISIADYFSVLHAAMNETAVSPNRVLPTEPNALAQYLLVYESSASPTDFEEEISSDHSSLLIRGFLNKHRFSETRPVVEALMTHLENEASNLAALGLKVSIAGDVNIAYHWMTRLIDSHFYGIGLALCLVLLMATLMYRSVFTGLLAVLPVGLTVLCVYGVMSLLDIHLDPPSSMFAAIAIGVGVDFSIHLLARVSEFKSLPLEQALDRALPETARACFFNALALAVGFSVLMLSLLPTLQRFGGFIALASAISFLAALVLVPAVMSLGERFFGARRQNRRAKPSLASEADSSGKTAANSAAAMVLLLAVGSISGESRAAERLPKFNGLEVATRVAQRAEGAASKRVIQMQLVDKRGRVRKREALVIKYQVNQIRYTRVTYLSPKPVREVSFLSHDKLDPGASDDRWLYLPATRKVRRVPSSDRGDYFLGTDFTYEDMQSELKFALDDYEFSLVPIKDPALSGTYRLRGAPKNRSIVRELGYGAFEATVDPATWMPSQIDFFGPKLKPLKSVAVSEVREIDGVWNAGIIECTNHRSGHKTVFSFSEIEYRAGMPDQLFEPAALARGAPQL